MRFPGVMVGGRVVDLVVHPAADAFPMLKGVEFEALRDDIARNGQREKIVLAGRALIDGRNRLMACLEAGVEPTFVQIADGVDEIDYIVSANLHRRHMNETQRAFVAAALVPMYHRKAKDRQRLGPGKMAEFGKGKSTEHAAKSVNVSPASVDAALKVKRDAAPEVLAATKEGRLKVSAAAELATLPKQHQREIVERVNDGQIQGRHVRGLVKHEKLKAAEKILRDGDPMLVEAARDGRVSLRAAAAASGLPAWRQRDIAVDPSRLREGATDNTATVEELASLLERRAEAYLDVLQRLVDIKAVLPSRLRRITAELESLQGDLRQVDP